VFRFIIAEDDWGLEWQIIDNSPLNSKLIPLYLKPQFVPRCKYFSSLL